MTPNDIHALVEAVVAELGAGWRSFPPDPERSWVGRQFALDDEPGIIGPVLCINEPETYGVPKGKIEVRAVLYGGRHAAHKALQATGVVAPRMSLLLSSKSKGKKIATEIQSKLLPDLLPYMEQLGAVSMIFDRLERQMAHLTQAAQITWRDLVPGDTATIRHGSWSGIKYGLFVVLGPKGVTIEVTGLDVNDTFTMAAIVRRGDDYARKRLAELPPEDTQWTAEEVAALESKVGPPLAFNRISMTDENGQPASAEEFSEAYAQALRDEAKEEA